MGQVYEAVIKMLLSRNEANEREIAELHSQHHAYATTISRYVDDNFLLRRQIEQQHSTCNETRKRCIWVQTVDVTDPTCNTKDNEDASAEVYRDGSGFDEE